MEFGNTAISKKVFAVIFAIAVALGVAIPTGAFNAQQASADTDERSTSGTMGHLEVEVSGKVTYQYDGQTYTQSVQVLTTDTFTVTATQNGSSFTDFERTGVKVGDGSTVGATVELSGSYPTGTKDNPVEYTITLSKNVYLEAAKITVPVTLSVTIDYWSLDNNCPGVWRDEDVSSWKAGYFIKGSGIDIDVTASLGSAITAGKVAIAKVVSNVNADGNPFYFTIQNSEGKYLTFANNAYTGTSDTLTDACKVAVKDDQKVVLSGIPVGTYRITEIQAGGYIVTDADGKATNKYTYDYTVENKDDSNIPVATFTNKKLSNEAGISIAKVAEGLASGYPNPTVNIYAADENGIKTANAVWSGALTANGDRLYLTTTLPAGTYVIEEIGQSVAGYDCETTLSGGATVNGLMFTVAAGNRYDLTITNVYETAKVDVAVEKVWDDADDQDGIRPDSVTVQLRADGQVVSGKTLVLNAANNWEGVFEGLTKFNGSTEIAYTVEEVVNQGTNLAKYEAVVTGSVEEGYTITNSYTPEVTTATISKIWDDADDQDGIRPDSVTVQLKAGGTAVEGKTAELNSSNGWSYTFDNLPKYANGKEVVYTVAELALTGAAAGKYVTAYNGLNITNTHTPDVADVTVTKSWDDADDQDGIRPTSIQVQLYADGEKVGDPVTLTGSSWSYTWENLAVNKNGAEIEYTVEEVNPPAGYTPSVSGLVITNTHTPETVSINGTKSWNDNGDQDGIRPASVTVNLLADGVEVDSAVVTGDSWSWSFTDLPKYKAGKEIVYTVTEDAVEGYAVAYSGYDITNTHTPETVEVEGRKTWDDNNNQDGIRPASITVNLLADGVEVDTAEVTASDGWSWSFTNLPKYKAGEEIVYTVTEDAVEGYTSEVFGYNIGNYHTPATVDISGVKTWTDDDDRDGLRPEFITVELYADGTATGKTATLTAETWTYSFEDLPKYKSQGVEIVYTVVEQTLTGDASGEYVVSYSGLNIINAHAPYLTDISVKKVWDDGDDRDGLRPESITVQLLANEQTCGDPVTLNNGNGWSHTWDSLYLNEAGEAIAYSVVEVDVPEGYESAIVAPTEGEALEDGEYGTYVVTNSHAPETIAVNGTKTWDDNGNQDGIRPDSIIVNLLANGDVVAEAEVSADANWSYAFDNLYKYEDGKEIVYSVEEAEVPEGYEASVDGFNITNTHVPETVAVFGTKVWDDEDDEDGIRPDSIIVNLLANGDVVAEAEVSAATQWSYSFTDMPKFATGEEIEYSVVEAEVPEGYEVSYELTVDKETGDIESVIINTHEPEPLPETGGEDPVLPATGDGMGLMARVAAGLACIAAAVCAFALRAARRVN